MKIKKILAAVAAAAVAVSAMAVNAFALGTADYLKDGVLYVNADKETDPTYAIDAGIDQTTITKVTFNVVFGSEEWIGGGIGANSPSTGWKSIEWGTNSKPITADLENGTITWDNEAPIFAADDAYAQLWLQTWSGTCTVNSVDIFDKDGNKINDNAAATAPAESEAAPAETEAAPAEEVSDEAPVEDETPADDQPAPVADEPAPAAPAETEPAAPAADAATTPAATGNVAVASIIAAMAVAGTVAITSKKRK